MRLPSFARRHPWIGLLIVATIAVASWMLLRAPHPATESMLLAAAGSEEPKPAGPPWLYGRADARFTVVGYADLECPYCRAYFPALKRWIDAHPEVNWQWHHLPLSMHEPAATAGARLVECAGETGGHATFWQAVAWLYSNTRGDGHGLRHRVRLSGRCRRGGALLGGGIRPRGARWRREAQGRHVSRGAFRVYAMKDTSDRGPVSGPLSP